MKNILPILRLRRNPQPQQLCASTGFAGEPTDAGVGESVLNTQALLIGLMVPNLVVLINSTMVRVALPAIRSDFNAQSDQIAWVVTAYTLPFMIMMPVYGRLADRFGKRQLLLVGISVFLLGTCINLSAPDLRLLLVGRAIQGVGTAGVTPLAIAMISELFPARQRGKALGTWNSIGPAAGVVGPLLVGVLIDRWGWRPIFVPALLAGLLAASAVQKCIPPDVKSNAQPGFLNRFDWGGVVLLSVAATTLLFYVSSRLITGVPSLRDWRLLALASFLLSSFVIWEKRHPNPFISLGILRHGALVKASLCASIRMIGMSGISFLLPLYLADIQNLNAAWIGITFLLHSGSLLATMRIGGQLADRWGSRRPVVLGMSMQVGGMVYFAFLPSTSALYMVVVGLVTHSLGAGLAQAALHRAAMGGVPQVQTGMVAGVYSMIRFGGTVLGPAVEGVFLQQGLDWGLPTIKAYQNVYWFIAGVVVLGVIVALTIREHPDHQTE